MAKAKKLPSGNWRVQVFAGRDENDKAIYKSFTAATRKEAEYAAAEFALTKKEIVSSITFGKALDAYIEMKSNILSPSTILGYKRIDKNYLAKFRTLPIDNITQVDVQKLINIISLNHSPKTVRNVHGLISAVLKVNRPNFILHTSLTQKEKIEIIIPTQDEIIEIYNLLHGTRLELPFLLASQCGLRASEIAGLTMASIDSANSTITIGRALVTGENGEALKPPKTFAGYRTIPCNDTIIKLCLQSGRDRIVEDRAEYISVSWRTFMRKSKTRKFKFHALRHYFASQAMLLGIPQKYIAELMGHASMKMLEEVYQHTFPDEKKKYATLLSKQLSNIISHEISHK